MSLGPDDLLHEDGTMKTWTELFPVDDTVPQYSIDNLEAIRERIGDEDFKAICAEFHQVINPRIGAIATAVSEGSKDAAVEALDRLRGAMHVLHPDYFAEKFGPFLAKTPQDLPWFQKVLAQSITEMEATPENFQPSWYRQYRQEHPLPTAR